MFITFVNKIKPFVKNGYIIRINDEKNLSFINYLLSLLFNIQVGFTHDIEHQYHDNVHLRFHHDSAP